MAGYERDPSLPDVGVPWSDIPTSDTVDEGKYIIRIGYFQEKKSQEGKRMAVLFSTIAEGPLTDVPFPIQNYVLGTEDDPLCTRDPNTWRKSFGGRQLNQILEACGTVKNEKSLSDSLRRAEQARLQVYVTKTMQEKGQYAGSFQNRIVRYAPYGTDMVVPRTTADAATNHHATAQPRSRMRPTLPGAMTDSQEQEEAVEETIPGLND
jgi:hypothetical protein